MLFLLSLTYEGYFISGGLYALTKARTMAISSAIIYELFFVFNCRSDNKSVWNKSFKDNFLSNKWLTLSVGVSLIFQLFFIYHPLFNTLFKTAPLGFFELLLVFVFASIGLLVTPTRFNKDLNTSKELL